MEFTTNWFVICASLLDRHATTVAQLKCNPVAHVMPKDVLPLGRQFEDRRAFVESARIYEIGEWDSFVLNLEDQLLDFLADRLKVQQREAGVRHDLIDAVFALGGEDDLVRLLARVKALQGFVGTEEGKNLLAGYKRAANILKKSNPSPLEGEGDSAKAERGEGGKGKPSTSSLEPLSPLAVGESPSPARGEGKIGLSYTSEIAEHALINVLDSAEPRATAAIEREDFEGAMSALASLRAPIDAFFETVTVNDPDPVKRDARLALLARVRDAVHRVADFSKIEG